MGIVLHQFPGAWGTTSVSPFCIKVEAYLRMRGLAFEVRDASPLSAPRGKLPVVDLDGEVIADSARILERLESHGEGPLDVRLTRTERARGHALTRMLEDATYFPMCWVRWGDPQGWRTYAPVMRGLVPAPLGYPVMALVRSKMLRMLQLQGTGRRPAAEIVRHIEDDFTAAAELLGDRSFLFGEAPTTADATLFAFVTAASRFPGPGPLPAFFAKQEALIAYRDRIEARYFASSAGASA